MCLVGAVDAQNHGSGWCGTENDPNIAIAGCSMLDIQRCRLACGQELHLFSCCAVFIPPLTRKASSFKIAISRLVQNSESGRQFWR